MCNITTGSYVGTLSLQLIVLPLETSEPYKLGACLTATGEEFEDHRLLLPFWMSASWFKEM